jgi:hypothetical protein
MIYIAIVTDKVALGKGDYASQEEDRPFPEAEQVPMDGVYDLLSPRDTSPHRKYQDRLNEGREDE